MNIQNSNLKYIPNMLSIYRIIAAPGLLVLVILGEENLFKWLLLVSLISDILDGVIARVFHLQTDLGARLDSIGDMSTFIVAIIGILQLRMTFIQEHMIGVSIILGFYLLQKIVALLKFHKITSFHTTFARINAYMQGIFIMTLFLFGFQGFIFYPTVLVSVYTYSEEILLVLILKEPRSNVGGIFRVIRERESG